MTSISIDHTINYIHNIYLEILISIVLARGAENSASKAGRARFDAVLGFRPLRACRYAATTGTISIILDRSLNTGNTAPPCRNETLGDLSATRMRHGIAASGRHVAPAVLL